MRMPEQELMLATSLAEVRVLAVQIMEDLGWSIEDVAETVLVAKTGVTFTSWGELIEVHLEREGSVTRVTARSEARAQLIDWGKSEENVAAFIAYLRANAAVKT